MGVDYRTIATFGVPVSRELMEQIAEEVCPEDWPVEDFLCELPYEFETYFYLDCDAYGDIMSGEEQYIVGINAFSYNMRFDGDEAYRPIKLLADDGRVEKLDEFIEKYGLPRPKWYAGMSVS